MKQKFMQKGGIHKVMFKVVQPASGRFGFRLPLLALLVAALVIASVPALGQEPAGEIDFLAWGDEVRLKPVLDAFREAYTTIKLNYIGGPYGEHLDKFKTMVASGSPPDIALVDGYDYATLAAQGLLMDLTPWAERDGILEELRRELHPAYLQEMMYEGRLYSLAQLFSSELGFFYNKDIIAEAGYPDLNTLGTAWTWSDFIEVARLTSKDVDGNGSLDQIGFTPANWQFWPWVLMNGGQLISEDLSHSPFDEADAYEALQFLSDLRNVHRVTGSDQQRWLNGQVAMREGWVSAESNSLSNSSINWDMAYFPAGKAGSITISKGNELVIPYNAANKELAWVFMKFGASEEAYYLYGANRSFFPPRRDAALRVLQLEQGYPEFIREFITQADIRNLPVINGFRAVYDIWVEEMRPLWAGQVSARVAGQRVAERSAIALRQAKELAVR